jgi:sulfonate transport system permease protein
MSIVPAAVGPQAPPMAVPRASAGSPGSPARRTTGAPWLRRARRLVGPLVVLLVWWVATRTGLIDQRFVSSPGKVLHVFSTEISSGVLQHNLGVSLGRVARGLILGVGLGLVVGCISGMSRVGDDLVDPVVQMFRTVPFVALTSLFILWFGINERPKYLLVALGCFFPMYLNTFNGIRNVDARLVEAARGFGLRRLGLVWEVIVLGALPQALLGLRYALGISWLALVIAEQINSNAGIGYLLTTAQNNLDTAGVIASIVTYAALGIITDALVRGLERRLLSWRRGYTGA